MFLKLEIHNIQSCPSDLVYEELLVRNVTRVEEGESNMTVLEGGEGVEEEEGGEEEESEDIVPDPEDVIDYTDTQMTRTGSPSQW